MVWIAVALLAVQGGPPCLIGDYTLGEVCSAVENDLQIEIETPAPMRNQCVYVSWERPFSEAELPTILASLGLRGRWDSQRRHITVERAPTQWESGFDNALRATFDTFLQRFAARSVSGHQDLDARCKGLLAAQKDPQWVKGSEEANANVRLLFEYEELRSAYFASKALRQKLAEEPGKRIADFQVPEHWALLKDPEMLGSLNFEVERIKSGKNPTDPEFFLSFDWSGGEFSCSVQKTFPFHTSSMSRLALRFPPLVDHKLEPAPAPILTKEFPLVDSILGIKGDYSLAMLPELVRLHGKNTIFWAPRRGVPFTHVSLPLKLLPNMNHSYTFGVGEVMRLGLMPLVKGQFKYTLDRAWFSLNESDHAIQLVKPDEPRVGTDVAWTKLLPILRRARSEHRRLTSEDMEAAIDALTFEEVLACSHVGFDRPDLPEAEQEFVQAIPLFVLVSNLESPDGSLQDTPGEALREEDMRLLVSLLRRASNWPKKSHMWRTHIASELAHARLIAAKGDLPSIVARGIRLVDETEREIDSLSCGVTRVHP